MILLQSVSSTLLVEFVHGCDCGYGYGGDVPADAASQPRAKS